MKKKLIIALFVLALMVCIFASCGKCKHESYEVKETVAATCVAEGRVVSACTECGEEKVESIAKLTTHKLTYEEVKPTCSVAGTITETCTVEGCTYTNVKAGQPATGTCKPENRVITSATCTVDGVRKYICTECQNEVWQPGFDSKIPALGHTYERDGVYTDEEKGISFVAGSCMGEGYFARVCQDCGYDQDPITREEYAQTPGYDVTIYDEMSSWEHDYATWLETVLPTCETNGYELYQCLTCDGTTEKEIVLALGHVYVKDETAEEGTHYVIDPQPTCINPGVKSYICTRCHEAAKVDEHRESVPTISHQFSDEMDDKLVMHLVADCLNPERKVFNCYIDPLCTEEKEFSYGEALGHDEQKGVVSCKTEGKTPYTCSRCDFYEERVDEFSNLSIKHTKGETLTTATCITNATYKCSECEKTYGPYADDNEYVDGFAHGLHDFDETNPLIVDPKCNEEGYNVYSCIADENCTATRKDYENTDMTQPDTPRAEDITARIPHVFGSLTEDGRIICANCPLQYRDVSTEITNGGGDLCLGCETEECTCGLKVEWNGYVSPADPEEITANEVFTKNDVDWEALGELDKPLVMGEGIIIITGTAETVYTISVYSEIGGEAITFTVSADAETIAIDLYKYETVAQISIESTTDATVSFFSIVKD